MINQNLGSEKAEVEATKRSVEAEVEKKLEAEKAKERKLRQPQSRPSKPAYG